MKVETDEKVVIEVTPFDGFKIIYNDELIGVFELNKKIVLLILLLLKNIKVIKNWLN